MNGQGQFVSGSDRRFPLCLQFGIARPRKSVNAFSICSRECEVLSRPLRQDCVEHARPVFERATFFHVVPLVDLAVGMPAAVHHLFDPDQRACTGAMAIEIMHIVVVKIIRLSPVAMPVFAGLQADTSAPSVDPFQDLSLKRGFTWTKIVLRDRQSRPKVR